MFRFVFFGWVVRDALLGDYLGFFLAYLNGSFFFGLSKAASRPGKRIRCYECTGPRGLSAVKAANGSRRAFVRPGCRHTNAAAGRAVSESSWLSYSTTYKHMQKAAESVSEANPSKCFRSNDCEQSMPWLRHRRQRQASDSGPQKICLVKFLRKLIPLRVQVPPEKGFNPPKPPQNTFLGDVLTVLDP